MLHSVNAKRLAMALVVIANIPVSSTIAMAASTIISFDTAPPFRRAVNTVVRPWLHTHRLTGTQNLDAAAGDLVGGRE